MEQPGKYQNKLTELKMTKPKGGYHYTVTEEQVRQHQKRSIKEILTWLHETNVFLNKIQTPVEKERMRKFREGTNE